MNKMGGGFTTEKGVNIHNALHSTCHVYKASYSLLFRQTDKKQQGCGDRIQNGTEGAMHYFHCISIHSLNCSHPHISNRKADERYIGGRRQLYMYAKCIFRG